MMHLASSEAQTKSCPNGDVKLINTLVEVCSCMSNVNKHPYMQRSMHVLPCEAANDQRQGQLHRIPSRQAQNWLLTLRKCSVSILHLTPKRVLCKLEVEVAIGNREIGVGVVVSGQSAEGSGQWDGSYGGCRWTECFFSLRV